MSIRACVTDGVEVLKSSLCPFPHGFSTRFGGVSRGDLSSLNLGVHRGDKRENVEENYRRFGTAVGFSPKETVFFRQIHGVTVRSVTKADCGYGLYRDSDTASDGLITDEPGVALVVFGADCPTILLWDSVKKVVCAVHSGWRGTAAGMARHAVRRMTEDYGCKAEHIGAVIGPCIGKCCFETRSEVPEAMEKALGSLARPYIEQTDPEHWHVDLKGINEVWLRQAGVKSIDVTPNCTRCEHTRFWSHRLTGDARGSQAAVILMR